MTVQVPVNGDYIVLIDEEDADSVLRLKWEVSKTSRAVGGFVHFAVRSRVRVNGRYVRKSLGTFLMNPGPGFEVDHKNGNSLDNRRENLRLATRSQNIANTRKSTSSKSPFKGIYFHKAKQRWHASAKFQGKPIHIGYFDSAVDAAIAYDNCARLIHGEFARLNFPKDGEQHA